MWQLNFNPVLVVLVSIVAGVVLIAFFIVAIVRWRTMKPSTHRYRGKLFIFLSILKIFANLVFLKWEKNSMHQIALQIFRQI